jgi:hypothetical protein
VDDKGGAYETEDEGTRHPLMRGTEVSHQGSTPRAGTTPASPISRTRMAISGCYRNGVTAMCNVLWKLRDVDEGVQSDSPL